MFIHPPNTSKQRATGSLLTPGAQGGRCSKIINSNARSSVFPIKFQGLLTPPPNSSTQKEPGSLTRLCCRACQFSLQSEKPKDLGPGSPHPSLSCLHQKKLLRSTSTSWQDWEGPNFHAMPGERSMLRQRELANLSCGWGTHVKPGSLLKHELS